MYKVILKQLFVILFIVFFSNSTIADGLFGTDDDKKFVWKSGINRYIKYSEPDSAKFGSNQHPVDIEQQGLKLALSALEIPDDSLLAQSEATKTVFTVQQIKLLSEELPKAFRNARPDQDIVFSIEKSERKLLGLQERRFLAGRTFYKDNRLNIIIGDYDFFRSKAFESVYDPSGQAAVPYNLNTGSRIKASNAFSGVFLNVEGIENKRLKKIRHDWFVIDIDATAKAYLARLNGIQNPETRQDKQLKLEAAKLARQRREMRAEMARLRKEMQKRNNSVVPSERSIEERIAILDELRKKELITQEEYDNKRQGILNDI